MGFTKLDERITRSSIMAEPAETFKVWVAMLAECGPDGVADVSAPYLARICYLPLKVVEKALRKLEGPDPRSRSKKKRGARIEEVDGGYFLVNYHQYRERGYSMSDEAVRSRKRRAEASGSFPILPGHSRSNRSMTGRSASASASASSSLKGQRKKGRSKRGVGGTAGRPAARTKRVDLVRLWNEFADRHRSESGPSVEPIIAIAEGSERERVLRARLKEPAFDFEKILAAAEGQSFLFGENERGWVLSFDWLLSSSNYVKVLEHQYKDRAKGESEIDAWVKKSKGVRA